MSDELFVLPSIPDGWFLRKLEHAHSPIQYKSDVHQPRNWKAEIQHVLGGRLSRGEGDTPGDAIEKAINHRSEPDYESAKRLFDGEAGAGLRTSEIWDKLPYAVRRLYINRAEREEPKQRKGPKFRTPYLPDKK